MFVLRRKIKVIVPPKFKADQSRREGSALYGFANDIPMTLLSIVPKKNKLVVFISSMHHKIAADPDKKKPEIICYYNKTKSGVDLLDLKGALYLINRRTRRWPLVVFYSILNSSCDNSYILYLCYRQNPVTKSLLKHWLSLWWTHISKDGSVGIPNLPKNIRPLIRQAIPEEQNTAAGGDGVPSDKLEKMKVCSLSVKGEKYFLQVYK